MSRFLSSSGTGRITNVSVPKVTRDGVPIPQDQVATLSIVVSVDNYDDFKTQGISMEKPRDEYHSSFNVGDEVTVEQYSTLITYARYRKDCQEEGRPARSETEYMQNPGHEIDFEIKPLVFGEKPRTR